MQNGRHCAFSCGRIDGRRLCTSPWWRRRARWWGWQGQRFTQRTSGAACFDLHTTHRGSVPALESTTFHTGLAVEVPDGHVLLIYSRSGHGFNHGLRLGNCVGILDSDYRGEVMVTARRYLAQMLAEGVIVKAGQGYTLAQA